MFSAIRSYILMRCSNSSFFLMRTSSQSLNMLIFAVIRIANGFLTVCLNYLQTNRKIASYLPKYNIRAFATECTFMLFKNGHFQLGQRHPDRLLDMLLFLRHSVVSYIHILYTRLLMPFPPYLQFRIHPQPSAADERGASSIGGIAALILFAISLRASS